MIFVGIDPGYTGAVVSLEATGEIRNVLSGFDPADPFAMWESVGTVLGPRRKLYEVSRIDDMRIAIEKVHAQPKFGAKGAFQFGGAAMLVSLAARETKMPVEFVVPKTWQRIYWGKVADTKKQARIVCKQLWPGRDWKHSGECDASLIAEWLRRRELGVAAKAEA